ILLIINLMNKILSLNIAWLCPKKRSHEMEISWTSLPKRKLLMSQTKKLPQNIGVKDSFGTECVCMEQGKSNSRFKSKSN
ncbi:hypothetical protein VIGAN_10054100, partial [Vigna angularis var. angularis]